MCRWIRDPPQTLTRADPLSEMDSARFCDKPRSSKMQHHLHATNPEKRYSSSVAGGAIAGLSGFMTEVSFWAPFHDYHVPPARPPHRFQSPHNEPARIDRVEICRVGGKKKNNINGWWSG